MSADDIESVYVPCNEREPIKFIAFRKAHHMWNWNLEHPFCAPIEDFHILHKSGVYNKETITTSKYYYIIFHCNNHLACPINPTIFKLFRKEIRGDCIIELCKVGDDKHRYLDPEDVILSAKNSFKVSEPEMKLLTVSRGFIKEFHNTYTIQIPFNSFQEAGTRIGKTLESSKSSQICKIKSQAYGDKDCIMYYMNKNGHLKWNRLQNIVGVYSDFIVIQQDVHNSTWKNIVLNNICQAEPNTEEKDVKVVPIYEDNKITARDLKLIHRILENEHDLESFRGMMAVEHIQMGTYYDILARDELEEFVNMDCTINQGCHRSGYNYFITKTFRLAKHADCPQIMEFLNGCIIKIKTPDRAVMDSYFDDTIKAYLDELFDETVIAVCNPKCIEIRYNYLKKISMFTGDLEDVNFFEIIPWMDKMYKNNMLVHTRKLKEANAKYNKRLLEFTEQ
tara:strand:+ start:8768 stop:10117 length:1350 start_codon:yes stop_codon:yes gene_type:complete